MEEPSRQRKSGVSRGKSVKNTRIDYEADLETLTDPSIEGRVRCWAWGIVPIETPEYENVIVGTNFDDFMEFVSRQNSTVYFHNLKFDGYYVLDWLLNNGYQHITDRDLYDDKTFKSLISDMGKFYSITVRWENGFSTEFRDSLKKLPMAVRRIAKSFNLEMSKGDIDYETYRPPNHILT